MYNIIRPAAWSIDFRRLSPYLLLAIPLMFALVIAMVFYPGCMTYDTLHALRGGRNGVTDSVWPPMVSYVWRAIDLVTHNPSAMHFSQVFFLLCAVFFLILNFTKKISYSSIFLLCYLTIPVILGTVAVIWKDVLMASFFLAGFSITLLINFVKSRGMYIALSLLAFFILFLGVCSRHNAIFGAVPLLYYFAIVVCARGSKTGFLRSWIGVVLSWLVLISIVFFSKTLIDQYSLPRLEKMPSATDYFLQTVRVLDVAGASLCAGKSLFGDMAPNLTLHDIRDLYNPTHANLSSALLGKVGVNNKINKIWLDVALQHPLCFFYNKLQLTKYLIGANKGPQFLVTSVQIDENEYGYVLPKSSIRDAIVSYIYHASKLFFFKPWFMYCIAIFAVIYMAWAKAVTTEYLILLLSAILYFISLVMFGNAADARLPFYTTTVLTMLTFICLANFIKTVKYRVKILHPLFSP